MELTIRGRTAALLIATSFLPTLAAAQETELFTGDAQRQVLAQSIEAVSWKGKTLRGALERITQTQHVALMLDRRVDPDQEIEFSASRIPLEVMIEQLAAKCDAATCHVGPVVYVGPRETCLLLPTVAELRREEIRKLPADQQRRLLRANTWQWKRLTTPRELLKELEREYSVRIDGKENMPHDLWPAMRLPPLDFAGKLSLVLAGFHVNFQFAADGKSVQIVAMPVEASLSRTYPAGARVGVLSRQLAEQFPDASIRGQGNNLLVDGRWEVHDAIERLLSGQRVRPPAPADDGVKNYTLTVENKAVGGVIRALGNQLGKKVVFDVKVDRRLTKEISINVKEVSLEELLSAVLSPASLKYEIDGDTIRVFD